MVLGGLGDGVNCSLLRHCSENTESFDRRRFTICEAFFIHSAWCWGYMNFKHVPVEWRVLYLRQSHCSLYMSPNFRHILSRYSVFSVSHQIFPRRCDSKIPFCWSCFLRTWLFAICYLQAYLCQSYWVFNVCHLHIIVMVWACMMNYWCPDFYFWSCFCQRCQEVGAREFSLECQSLLRTRDRSLIR